VRLVGLAILGILVLASLPGTGRAAADAPRWTVGDFWEYDIETLVQADLVLNGTVRATVSDLGPRTVKGAAVDAFTTVLTGGGKVEGPPEVGSVTGRWSYAGEQWVDARTFTVVRSVLQIDANGTAPPFGFSFLVQNTTEHEVVSDTWHYPIDIGTTGTLVTDTTATERVRIRYGLFLVDSDVTATYRRSVSLYVSDAPKVRVAAGTFPSLEVDVGWPTGDVDKWFYAPSIGNNARTESYDEGGTRVAASSLRAFRYQAGEPPFPFGLSAPIAAALAGAVGAGTAVAFWVLLRGRRLHQGTAESPPRPRGPT